MHYIYRVDRKRDMTMIEQIQNYIKACEENIVRYKAMGDQKAVEAAEGMIRDFEEALNEINAIMEL